MKVRVWREEAMTNRQASLTEQPAPVVATYCMYISGSGVDDLLRGYRGNEYESTYVREPCRRGGLHLWENALLSPVRKWWESVSSILDFVMRARLCQFPFGFTDDFEGRYNNLAQRERNGEEKRRVKYPLTFRNYMLVYTDCLICVQDSNSFFYQLYLDDACVNDNVDTCIKNVIQI